MRIVHLLVVVACFAEAARARTADAQSAGVSLAIERGLEFLARDAVRWREEHQCVSCHHAGMVVWSMHEAKRMGYGVDETVLAEMAQWIADSGDGKTSIVRPADVPQAINIKAVWFALALAADPRPNEADEQSMKRLLKTIQSDQGMDGSWDWWPETRPPFFGTSDASVTVLAALALVRAADSGDGAARAALNRAVTWLNESPGDDDPQSLAMRLVLWRRLDRPQVEIEVLVEKIQRRQNHDGGWSQASGIPSDAWGTGQALYALAIAGRGSNPAVLARARAFLVKTQREDGSWPMTSRPIQPGGEGSKSLVPITGAGTAWGVLGLALARSLP